MSIAFDVIPEILLKGHPLTLFFKNPTDTTQDVTIEFISDTTVLMSVTRTGLRSGEADISTLDWSLMDGVLPLDKAIAVRGKIPTPVTGVLLGTTVAPAETGGANAIMITSSSAKIKFIDELKRPIPYFHCMLFDQQTRKVYKYVSDKYGIVTIPSRITA